ncbi:MAG TPA: sugar transferase [Thermoanaerobaculia bacterium]|nr:sugar transferase [Thermoanaerobaculia bacterium]
MPAEGILGRSYARWGKRSLDLALILPGVVLLSPVMLVVAGLVLLTLGAPVIFRQARPGVGGRPFELLKFRSMREALDDTGHLRPDAERLTAFGKFLRRTSLDELPELWNVLRGDMSLVGPRPLLMGYLPLYSPEQARRHEVRPGITGWAQVNGRNALSWEEKFRLDVEYVNRCSLAMDLRILAMTAAAVATGRGVAAEGSATMPRFTGSRT